MFTRYFDPTAIPDIAQYAEDIRLHLSVAEQQPNGGNEIVLIDLDGSGAWQRQKLRCKNVAWKG